MDVGCGEGKNAAYLAKQGANVTAVDCSEVAIQNGMRAWPDLKIDWKCLDVKDLVLGDQYFDIIISYGLLHCLESIEEMRSQISLYREATKNQGYNIVCCFNDRFQELHAHPGFQPLLLNHNDYLEMYEGWLIISASDKDLVEKHPHNAIWHTHSLTRLIAQRL